MDTEEDIIRERALDRLLLHRERKPCDVFDSASRLLAEWCLCGWELKDHVIKGGKNADES